MGDIEKDSEEEEEEIEMPKKTKVKGLLILQKVQDNSKDNTPKNIFNLEFNEKIGCKNNHPYNFLIFSPKIIRDNIFKRHLLITYKGCAYGSKSLKQPSFNHIKAKQINLPENGNLKIF